MEVKVSIIIPVYNTADYLERCLDSCLEQTFSSLEIIAVNDSSTDRSAEILEAYAQKDARVRPFTKKKEGAFLARDYGVKQSSGQYFFFLDSDDYIPENAIERLYTQIQETESQIAVADFEFINHPSLTHFHYPAKQKVLNGEEFINLVFDTEVTCIWGKLFDKSLHHEMDYWDDMDIGEDLLYLLQLCAKKNIRICFVPEPLYYYVQRPGSIMNEPDEQVQAERYLAVHYGLDELVWTGIFTKRIATRIRAYGLEKLCYYLRVVGSDRGNAAVIRDTISAYFIEQKDVRDYIWNKNKRIGFMLTVGYLSPWLAKKFSQTRRLFSGK